MKEKWIKRMHFMNLYELRAIEEYLEEMAAKGLMFVKVRGLFFYFRKCEPRKVKFCVDVFGKTSFFRKEHGQTARDYIDYCEAAGWHHVSARDKWHFFYTEDLSCVPIHTDSKMQFKMINHQVLKESALLWVVYTYMFFKFLWDSFTYETWVDRLIQMESIGLTICAIFVFFVLDAMWYVIFYVRNCWRIRRNQPLHFSKKVTVEFLLGIRNGIALFGVIANSLLLLSLFDSMMVGIVLACVLPLVIVLIWELLQRKKKDWGRRNTYIVFCISIVFCMICSYSLVVKAIVYFSEKDNVTSVMVYDEEEKCDIEYFISDEKIPYELTHIPEGTAHNSKEKQVESSVFGKYTSYDHCCYDKKMEVLGDLSYDVIRTPFDFILEDYVENEMKLDYLQVTDITEQESELWGAQKVYLRQNGEEKSYIGRMVLYEDCLLIIFSNQLTYNPQEIKEITDKVLGSE